MKRALVFGSFVVDLMSRTPHLPKPGETVKGSLFRMGPGGKGFNQGVAAHKAGANVIMCTKLGRDSFAKVATDAMDELYMNTDYVLYSDDTETGSALIMVDEKTSQNEIVVVLGACNTITDNEVESLIPVLEESEYVLTQLETNVSAIYKLIDLAHDHGVKVILNTAPVQEINNEIYKKIDIITPNEVEAEILTGIRIDSLEEAKEAAKWFRNHGVKEVIITLGGRGVFVSSNDRDEIIPAYNVEAIDTTGAGDAFNGGLLAALSEGKDIWNAVMFANALAALSVQKLGTTPSMPTRNEIDDFIRENQ